MVRLESFLEGEPDSRQEIIQRDLQGKSLAELKALLDVELRGLGAIDARFQVVDEASAEPEKAPNKK